MGYIPRHSWELFARELVELQLAGDPKARIKAYERAGLGVLGSRSNPSNARRLANRQIVRDRVTELFQQACEYRDITVVKIVNRIDRVADANLSDLYEDDGKTLKNIKTLPRRITDAIESIDWIEDGTTESGEVRYRGKVKLFDKNQANFTLLKHYGGLPEPAPPAQVTNIFNELTVDDQQVLLGIFEAVPPGTGGVKAVAEREHSEG